MRGHRIAAWGVHLLTASGAVLSLLALEATTRQDWWEALVWMALAMVVDSVDGTLARLARVRTVLPAFDGALLDSILDYLGYVVVPAILVVRAGLVPPGARVPVAAAILVASAYQFCHRDAKTEDHFFRGFPCFWNVVVFYMFFVPVVAPANLVILCLLCALVFVPVKWAYPSRMLRLRAPMLALTILWGVSIAGLLAGYPHPPPTLLAASLAYPIVYTAVSLWLSLRPAPGRRRPERRPGAPADTAGP